MLDPTAISTVVNLFIPRIRSHHSQIPAPGRPYILAVSGLQGSGKSTWSKALTQSLNAEHGINTRTVSLDDFYHDHETLKTIRETNADNPLLRTRGQPGTHDEKLCAAFLASLASSQDTQSPILLPAFDKSKFGGEGDRVPIEQWERVPREPRLQVLILEGWCVGFQPLSDDDVQAAKQAASTSQSEQNELSITTLATHKLEHLHLINDNLRRYCSTFMGRSDFDGLLHLNTADLRHVYHWRLDQEHALLKASGSGMSDDEVIRFVRGYMPAYELYLAQLGEEPFFDSSSDKLHVAVLLDRSRTVTEIQERT
ncbi:P-loop containing nucleoside triphosphate hydrolase protein [Xylariaceae sp. FL1272]|nr:P-loop containing nucleoside triphosphate hydrolase protein [Xylariaceae sp. FL1272]